jgi:hypothetical protein
MKIKLNRVLYFLKRKLLMNIMRTFIFLFFTAAFSISPNNVLSQNVKIKIEVDKSITVDEVFDLIMQQTDYKFMYQEGIFKDFPEVNVKKGLVNANKLLEKSLSSGYFLISIGKNNTVVVIKNTSAIEVNQTLQTKVITGKVTDENDVP